jgi:hypothetical protein
MSTNKKTLLYSAADKINLTIGGIKDKLLNDFNIECFDPTATYNPSTHVLVIDRYEYNRTGWHLPLQEQGFKTIVEYFWDSGKDEVTTVENQTLNIRVKEWLWIYSYLTGRHAEFDRGPTRIINPDKFFLLLMNLKRDSRDQLFKEVSPYLDASLYSYRGRGIFIPGDVPPRLGIPAPNLEQQFSNPMWYDRTNFSLVAETLPTGEQLFVSEKTFKPIILMHPFIVYGSRGTLAYLHKLGFQTFDHVIDESYDLGNTLNERLNSISGVLSTLYHEWSWNGKKLFADAESQSRILHNYNRFHDVAIVDRLWQTQVVDVIKEFVDA